MQDFRTYREALAAIVEARQVAESVPAYLIKAARELLERGEEQ